MKLLRRSSKRRYREPPKLYNDLWHAWSHQSDQASPQVDWDSVHRALTTPANSGGGGGGSDNGGSVLARYSDGARDDMLLLHFICALNPPIHVVDAAIAAYPEGPSRQSTVGGLIPLMVACGRSASVPVILRLYNSSTRDCLRIKDSNGFGAVHWACRQEVSYEILRLLLVLDPELATTEAYSHYTSSSQTPIDMIMSQKSLLLDHAWDWNQWKKLSYLLFCLHYGCINARSEHSYSALHAALATASPRYAASVLDKAIALHAKDMAGVRDIFGNMPLHYAIRWHSRASLSHIKQLLQAFPQAVMMVDSEKILPLHRSIASGRSWQDGTGDIYALYPQAGTFRDSTSLLYPAFTAASIGLDLTTVFCLLKECPQILVFP